MSEEIRTAILGPKLTELILPDYADEQQCINAILNGTAGGLPWQVDAKGEHFFEVPLCAGHIYSQPQNKGPQPAPVMVIGKLPRPADIEDEDKPNALRRCFSPESHAGEFFRDTAAEFGVDISTWYVTYLFKTLHPEDPNRGSRLKAIWLKEAFPILQYEVTQVAPSYILVFGSEAVKALFGHTAKITDLTGSILEYEYTDYKGHQRVAKCVACTSPHAVIRASDAEEMAKYKTAFRLFVNLLNDTVLTETHNHSTIRTIDEWRQFVTTVKTECTDRILAIDAEWNGQHPQNADCWLRTIQFSWKPNTAAALIVRDTEGKELFTDAELKEIQQDFYEMWCNYIICGHYLDSDTEMLAAEGYIPQIFDLPFIPPTAEDYKQRIQARQPCLFDTAIAAHAFCETDDHSLTGQYMLRCPNVPRYETILEQWKKEYCKVHKLKEKELNGFGPCPDDILVYYGCYDADVTRRLALFYMENLEKDPYGLDCWEAFSNSMQQWGAFLEMNCTGLTVDRGRMDDLTNLYKREAKRLQGIVERNMCWPGLNTNSAYQLRELLFGEKYNGAKSKGCLRPPGALSLGLEPVYDTEGTPWAKAVELLGDLASPTCNGRSLSMLAYKYQELYKKSNNPVDAFRVETLRSIRGLKLLNKALSYVLKDSTTDSDGNTVERGLAAYICDDGKLRTHLYCTLDTGRAASARPAMQNISKRREADYKAIVGEKYIAPLRSILTAPPGYMLIAADFLGAELFACAVLSGDAKMLDHVQRNQLPEDHPDFYDIHSQIAVSSFRLPCEPVKGHEADPEKGIPAVGLKGIGKAHLRVVAKSVIFGMLYGRGAAAIAEAVREENVFISVEEARQIIDAVAKTYPDAMKFLSIAAQSVYAPGYIIGVCGRPRRTPMCGHLPADKLAEMERIFKNFPEQNFVAEAMRMALSNLYNWRFEHDDEYQICLQVHDEVLLCAPYAHVPNIVDTVLPKCMVEGTKIFARDLRGNLITNRGPYSMGIDITVGTRYSEGLKDWREICQSRL